MTKQKSDIIQYCNYLEELKERLAVIQKFTTGQLSINSLGREDFDIEFVAIQLRKSLELIAFSSLIANKKLYSETYKNFSKHWNPKLLLKDLKRINPDFYPRPVYLENEENKGVKKLSYLEEGFLTEQDFVFLYDKCGKALHAMNPYQTTYEINFRISITEWVDKIGKLLYLHKVNLTNSDEKWLIYLQHPDDGKVHNLLVSKITNEKT